MIVNISLQIDNTSDVLTMYNLLKSNILRALAVVF